MYGMASGDFAGSLINATPGTYYTIEIDTNSDQLADASGSTFMESFNVSGSMSLGTNSVKARVSEYDMLTGQYASGSWQAFSVSDGAVANTLPVMTGLAFTNPSAMSGLVSGDFAGTLSDTTPAMSYTVEIDTNGDQLPDISGLVSPGGFTFNGTVTVGTTSITARAMEYVSATGQYEYSNWQSFTGTGTEAAGGSGSGSNSSTGDSSGSGSGYVDPTTQSGSTGATSGGTTSTTSTSTSTSISPVWTMANATVLDTSAADSAFSAAVLGALGSYGSLLQAAADARADADDAAWDTFVGLIDAANDTLDTANAGSLANYTSSVDDADQQLEDADNTAWADYDDQIAGLADDYDDAVEGAEAALNIAYVAARATESAANQASADTYDDVMDGADATYNSTMLAAGLVQGAAITTADTAYNAAVAAASTALSNAMMAYMQQMMNGGAGAGMGGNGIPLDVASDALYQSDMAAAAAAYTSASSSTNAAYDTVYAAAAATYDTAAAAANAAYQISLAANQAAFELAYDDAADTYWSEVADHAATASAAIATATTTRDTALDAADAAYDSDVADAAATRASEHTAHLATYTTGEEAEWQTLQSDLIDSEATHATAVADSVTTGNDALDAAWEDYDLVANDPLSTSSDLDNALAQRLIAVAGALAAYNNSVAGADAAQTDADTDSWAAYDTAVNGLITGYWNSEAQSDADETHAINAAYVTWVTDWDAAWVAYGGDVAAADAQQALDDAQSANDAWHDIHAAAVVQFVADADAGNVYSHALAGIDAAYVSTMEAAWVVYADAMTDAGTAQSVAGANAYAAAVGRWASAEGGPYAAYTAAVEVANAVRNAGWMTAYGNFAKAMHAADAAWVGTVLPAWVTYQGEVSDHAAAWVAEAAPAWETYGNAYVDASLAYTTAAVPLGVTLSADLSGNLTTWVNTVATADETYSNELADHGVTWVADATSAGEGHASETIVNATTYVHATTGLNVMLAGAIGEAVTNWAGTVAGQLTGTPYTPPASNVSWPTGNGGSGGGTVAYGGNGGGTGGQVNPPASSPNIPIGLSIDLSIAFNQGDLASVTADWWNYVWSDYHWNFSASHPDWDSIRLAPCEFRYLKFDKVVFSGHGSPGSFGCFRANQFLNDDDTPLQTSTPAKAFFKNLGEHLNTGAHIDIRHCSVAGNDRGKEMLKQIAILTGATVHAYTSTYAVSPHGEEWVFFPDGTSRMIKDHGPNTGPGSMKPPKW